MFSDPKPFFFGDLLKEINARRIHIAPLVLNLLILLFNMFKHFPRSVARYGQIKMKNKEAKYGNTDKSTHNRSDNDDCDLVYASC